MKFSITSILHREQSPQLHEIEKNQQSYSINEEQKHVVAHHVKEAQLKGVVYCSSCRCYPIFLLAMHSIHSHWVK